MVKKLGKKRKEQTPLSKVLSSSDSRKVVLNHFFGKLTPHEIRLAVTSLENHRHFKQAISSHKHNFKFIYSKMTPESTLIKNIGWCIGLLETHKEKIKLFLEKENDLLLCFFRGNFDACLTIIDDLEKICGVSLWSIGIRGSLLSLSNKTEEKRELTLEINNNSSTNNFLKTTANLLANKYDDNSTLPAFNNFAEQKIRRSFIGGLLHFLMYKIVPINYSFAYDFNEILNKEKNTTAIDILNCLLDMVRFSIIKSTKGDYYHESQLVISNLYKLFPTKKIESLANAFDIETPYDFIKSEIDIIDEYTAGNYSSVCRTFEQNQQYALKFSLFEIWVKSACRTKTFPDNFLGELVSLTTSIILKDENYDSALNRIYLLCQSFNAISWFKEFEMFITREARFISKEVNNSLDNASTIISDVNSPLRFEKLPKKVSTEYAKALIKHAPYSNSVRLFLSDVDIDEKIESGLDIEANRKKRYKALKFIKNGENDKAIDILKELSQSEDIIVKNEAYHYLVSTYISMGEVERALSAYVNIVMSNINLLDSFDSETLCESAQEIIKESKDITVSIALSLHSINFNNEYDAALKFAFEKFITNNGFSNPLELFEHKLEIEKEQLYYFLEYVCIPENMKLYLYFDTNKEIEECRIEICKKLIEKGHSQEKLVFEVKERTKRQVILNAVKQVDNSRIHADISNLINSTNIRQLFDSFSNLRSKVFFSTEDEIQFEKLMASIDDLKKQNAFEQALSMIHVQDIVLNEKNSIFLRLVKLVRDEFTFGAKGLNGHLSTRIRHGHLPNTLKKCFSEQNLVSPKVSLTGSFKKNEFWLDKFNHLSESKLTLLDKDFSDFSSKLFDLINEINDKWLQVVVYDQDIAGLDGGELKKIALFNYSTTYVESYYLQKSLSVGSDYGDFIKQVTSWLWRKTEQNLENIRHEIGSTLRERLIKLLDGLEKAVFSQVGDCIGFAEFNESMAISRRKINSALDLIIGWFHRSKGLSIPSFDSDTVISITEWSAGAKVENIDTTGFSYQGRALTYFVDAMYVLLENCVDKSNLEKNQLTINTTWEVVDNDLIIKTVNNCFPITSLVDSNKALDFYRESYGQEEYSIKAAQGEGNSGFFKVWKSLYKDLDLEHSIWFGYTSLTEFSVIITIPYSHLAKVLYNANSIN
ncbi:tetratricopeptide repeat protein [Enterobacter hormaechei]|uniref:tetratricopeptide repeat protein n=1 Tax=Enterobacter hormaechei TaxID=158836 RepID=UPI003F5630C8